MAGFSLQALGFPEIHGDNGPIWWGSSRVPAVRTAIARAAPSARLATGSDFLSVALGLTQMAAIRA
jgi:hypothetical chaperone protein